MSPTSPTDPPALPSKQPPSRRRFLGRALFVAACLVTFPFAIYLEEKIRGRAAWRAYETGAKARGVKLDFADYIPPQIPDAENFASIPLFEAVFRAADAREPIPNPLKLPISPDGRLPKFSDPIKQERIDLAAWQKFFVATGLLSTASDDAAADADARLLHSAHQEVREGGTPSPAHGTCALPGTHRLAPLARRTARSAIPTRLRRHLQSARRPHPPR